MRNLERTVISQYANSPILLKVISQLNITLDVEADIQRFYEMIWNVETAQGIGLDGVK